MHEYNKKTIDEIIWVVYKTGQEGTMFHYKDDEHAQEHITNFLKEIGKIKDSNPIVEYKGEFFRNNEDCITYLQEYNDHINTTLQDHINKKDRGATVLYIGCSERDKFIQEGDLT